MLCIVHLKLFILHFQFSILPRETFFPPNQTCRRRLQPSVSILFLSGQGEAVPRDVAPSHEPGDGRARHRVVLSNTATGLWVRVAGWRADVDGGGVFQACHRAPILAGAAGDGGVERVADQRGAARRGVGETSGGVSFLGRGQCRRPGEAP